MTAKEIVDGMANDEQGREIVAIISRAVWQFRGTPAVMARNQTLAILQALAEKGFYVGSTMSKDLEEIDDAIDH